MGETDDRCLKTTDLQKAVDYYYEMFRTPGWYATTNAAGCTPPAASDVDTSREADAAYATQYFDSTIGPFHGPLGYSSDPNDLVNGYNTLHQAGVDNADYRYGYFYSGYARHYRHGRRGLSIHVWRG